MIADPLTFTDSIYSRPPSFVRLSQSDSTSDWLDTFADGDGKRTIAKISHALQGKGGVTRRSLLQFRYDEKSSTGSEAFTLNVTVTRPVVPVLIGEADMTRVINAASQFLLVGGAGIAANDKLLRFLRGEY